MPKRGPAPHSVLLAEDIENHVLNVFQSHPAEMAGALIFTSSLWHFSNKTAAARYDVKTEQKENAFRQWLGVRRASGHFDNDTDLFRHWVGLIHPIRGA